MVKDPRRGDVWLAELSPTLGHEQNGRRPVLIISADPVNTGSSGLVIVLPITSQTKLLKGQIIVSPPEGGLKTDSAIKCEQIRTIDKEKRLIEKMGQVTTNTMSRVEDAVKMLLGF